MKLRCTSHLWLTAVFLAAPLGRAAQGDWRLDEHTARQTEIAEAFQVHWSDLPDLADVRLRARVTLEDGAKFLSAGFLLRARSVDDAVLGYFAAGVEQKLQLALARGGAVEYPRVAGHLAWPIERGREYELELRARGPNVELRLDGRVMAALHDAPVQAGKIGLFTFDCAATFRDFVCEALPAGLEVHDRVPLLGPLGGEIAPAAQSLGSLIDRTAAFALSDRGEGGVTRDADGRPLPPYLCHAVLDADDQLRYAGAYNAFHHGLFAQGFLDEWVYGGDEEFLRRAVQLAEWNLVRLTPADWLYGSLPYSTTSGGEVGGLTDQESLQPDKAAYFGSALARLARVTGEGRYSDAARNIARTLVRTQREDGSWPFRVHPRSGEVLEPYTSSIVPMLRLFDAVEAVDRRGEFREARRRAFDWLLAGPVVSEDWFGYYEDVGPGARSFDQWMPEEAILYFLDPSVLDSDDERPGLLEAAVRMEEYVERRFLTYHDTRGPGVLEQTVCYVPMNFHTLHWALAADSLGEATQNELLRRAAISAVHTATWNQEADGRSLSVDVFERGTWRETWYSLAFSPLTFGIPFLARHPELAPADESHLLGHSAEIRAIRYEPERIEYETDGPSEDLLRLRGEPRGVAVGGTSLPRTNELRSGAWTFDPALGLLRVRHGGGAVRVELGPVK